MRLDLTKPWTVLGVPAALLGVFWVSPAWAQSGCTLRGVSVMPKTATLHDSASGGRELARFTGAKVDLTVTSVPESPGGRAAVTTGGFRLKGFVRAKDVPVYTARSVPVYAGHVWIADGRRVSILSGSGARLHVEMGASSPLTGYFHGWAPCESFSLSPKVPSGWAPDGTARGYVVKKARIDLLDEPRGSAVTQIEPASDGHGVLLWGGEMQGGYVHVEHHGDVILDGWVRMSDVSALPPGETMDQLAPSAVLPGSPQLSTQGSTKIVHVSRPVTLRGSASETGVEIGLIEAGTDVIVTDSVAGWASVVPRTLEVAPVGESQFWAREKDLGM